jgi:tight adherence protein B
MLPVLGFAIFTALAVAGVLAWRRMALRQLALDRLASPLEMPAETHVPQAGASRAAAARLRGRGPLARSWWWAPWTLGLATALALHFAAGFWLIYAGAVGLIVALLTSEVEIFWANRRAALLEGQLADAIDLMIGGLGAGTGLTSALAAAAEEAKQPLRGQLDEVLGRIRLGDEPQLVFRNLAERVPLESFTLFASALAVNWEVGGSLTPTLAMVGRTIRDRIEIGRRIQSNSAQSQLSTVFILLLTYFIAAVVWRNNPQQMESFLATEMGSYFVAGSMVLQVVGMVWMRWISKPGV